MTDNEKNQQANEVFNTLCAAIERRHWEYEKEEDGLLVQFDVDGDDIPMHFIIIVDADRQLIRLLSPLSFKISEAKRMDGAIATCAVTFSLADGSFDYDLSDGMIAFRMTASFHESKIGDGLFQYMMSCACAVVDEYNDRFLALNKGLITIDDFLK